MCRRGGGQRLAVPLLLLVVWATLATITFCIDTPQGVTPQVVLPQRVVPDISSIEDLMTVVPERPFHTLADIDAYIGDLLDLADLFLEKAFTAETRRYKRDVIQSFDVTSINVTGAQFHTLKFINPTEFNATSLERVNGRHVLRTPEKDYWILGYSRHEWQSVVEMSRPDYRIKLLARFQLPSYSIDKIDRIAAGINLGYLWIALGSTESSLVSIVCVSTRTGQWIVPQEITIHGVLGALHMFEASNKLYLVVGEQANLLPDVDAALYVLMDNYFDRRDDVHFRVNGVQDIKGFVDSESFYYLVFGSESPQQGSQVYQFDMLVDTVNLVQVLPDKTLQVLHFGDQHDAKNYILMISNDALPKIYRWSNQQLRLWQTLVSEGFDSCCSMGFLTLENLENIIFIAQGDTITFYTDDMTGHYFPTFTLRTGCSVIKDIDGMKLGKDYIITYICKDDHGNGIRLQAQRLIFHELKLAKPKTMADDLLQCLDEARTLLDERKPNIEYLRNITTTGSIMTMDGSQTWTGLVTFSKGLTVTGTTTFNKVNIKPTGNIVPTPGSLAELFSNINSLKSSVEELAEDLDKVLYYSGAQTITGTITASTLTVDNMDIDTLQVDKVNGIPLANLKDVFMINGLDQTINESFSVTNLMADSFTTRSHSHAGNINGVLTNEYMRLSVRDQMVVGDHTYSFILSSDIINKEEDIMITINGIDTATIVTQDDDATFHDFKVFDGLIIHDSMNTGLVNNVNVSSLVHRVIYTDVTEQQTLSGTYTLASVQVDGNVDATTINGIDLRELDAAVVKTTGDFTLLGPVTYRESLTVTGSLTTITINGVEWDNLMDLDSSDLVSTNYYFDNAVVVDAIRSNSINGLDFSRDVVLVDTPQTITGDISFMADVEVTGAAGVVLEDGGTVNGIDPSQLQVNVDGLVNIIIDEEIYLNAPLKCSGDVVVTAINDLVLDDIENRYWRHSLNQEINVDIHINQAEFHAPVTGLTINGNHILDYLHSSRLQYGSGTYIFKGPVIVEGDLEMEVDNTVDGVDVSELDRNTLKLYGEETIEGFINFSGSVIVVGDLVLTGQLNGLNVTSDLMMLDQSIPHTGHVIFREDTKVTSITLSGNMIVDTLNGLDVAKAAAEVVLLEENATISGDLQFTGTVNVNSLIVNGTVDEVNINDLAVRSLKKSSSTTQLVTGRIVVKESVHFSQGPYLGVVNSKEWTTHLTNVVLQDYSGTISGVKTFLHPIHISRNFDPITINTINVADLAARILTKSTEQIILRHYTFNNSISAIDMTADIIDGIAVTDLQLIDEVGSVGGTVTFVKNVTFLGGLNSTTGVLDGCDILEANRNAIWKSENGSMNLHLPVVVDSLTVMGSVTSYGDMLAGTSNLVDVMHFLQTLVLRSSDQEITGRVEFLRDVDIINLHVDTIDGVNIDKLYSETVLDNGDMIIRCNLDFTKPLTVGLMKVKRALSGIGSGGVLVNGIDVSDVASRVVLATGGTYIIKGRKTFTHGFHTHHLNVTGSLGGVPMEDFVVLDSIDIIEGISFTRPITIRGNLQVSGLVDGVDLALLFNSRVTLDQDKNLLGSWRFEAIRVEGDLEVDEINDVLVSDLVVKSGKKSQEIIGSKTFAGGLHVKGDIHTTLLNGLDILQLNRTIVRKDQDAIIAGVVTFENVVRASKNVLVSGTVNGFELSELNYNLSPLRRIIDEQYERINRLRSLLASFTVANFANARRLELAYLEKKGFVSLTDYGNLWFGVDHNLESNDYLIVRSHGSDCICCSPKTSFFQVNSDGSIASEATLDLSGAVFILTHPAVNLQITLNRRCTEGVPTSIAVDDTTSKPPVNLMTIMSYLDVITDAEMFVDNGIVYIVTLSALHHEFNQTGTVINTLKIDLSLNNVIVVWSRQTNYSASKLDMTVIEGRLYLLVANHMKADEVDTFRATSQLYLWESIGTKFQLEGEYLAEHVTSGIFFKSLLPIEETFFALAQLKAADSPVFENNLKYTTEVLIFRYNEAEEKFKKFNCLPSYGVLDQVPLTVDCTLYLLLLSKETLHVYEYYPPEGFRLYQTLTIKNAYALVIFEVSDGTFVAVSVQSPPGVQVLKVNTKGVKPYKLLL